jgi:hypothetical protein
MRENWTAFSEKFKHVCDQSLLFLNADTFKAYLYTNVSYLQMN